MRVKPNAAALRRSIGSLVSLALFVGALMGGVLVRSAVAQEVIIAPAAEPLPLEPEWWQEIDLLVTPYVWLPWVSSTVRPSNRAIPSASSTTDPGALYGHVTWVPFSGSAEFRDGPYGLVLDYIHVPLRIGINTRNIFFSGATAGLTQDTGTAMFLYRALNESDQYVDVGLGVRAWGFTGDITLNEGLLPAFNASNGISWADALIGVRYRRDLGNGFGATAYGDIGGFGAGAHIDWQLVGTIDYAVNSWIELHGGFRSLNFNYGAARADFSANLYGPILSATFRF